MTEKQALDFLMEEIKKRYYECDVAIASRRDVHLAMKSVVGAITFLFIEHRDILESEEIAKKYLLRTLENCL